MLRVCVTMCALQQFCTIIFDRLLIDVKMYVDEKTAENLVFVEISEKSFTECV